MISLVHAVNERCQSVALFTVSCTLVCFDPNCNQMQCLKAFPSTPEQTRDGVSPKGGKLQTTICAVQLLDLSRERNSYNTDPNINSLVTQSEHSHAMPDCVLAMCYLSFIAMMEC